jgi:hypothetical protein
MKNQLNALLQFLSQEQLNKEVINIEYTSELNNILSADKLTVEIAGGTKKLFFAGLGETKNYNGTWHLFYKTKQDRLIVKPKLIQEYLNA